MGRADGFSRESRSTCLREYLSRDETDLLTWFGRQDPVIALEEALQKIENDKVKFVNYTKACADRRDSSKAQLAMAYKAKEEFRACFAFCIFTVIPRH